MHGLEEALAKGIKMKSRKGVIPANVKTLMKVAAMTAFTDELQKLASEGDIEAAAEKLQKPRPWKTIGQTASLVGTVAPAIDAAGRFTKGFVNAKGPVGRRVAGGAKELADITKGDLAAKALTSGLGGGAIAAAKEGIELRNARKSVEGYLRDKLSGFLTGPSGPSVPTKQAPSVSTLRGSSTKSQRVGNTPIAAKSGVTNSASGDALNPRRSLGDAIRAYKT